MSESFPLKDVEPTLRRVLADLDALGAKYALIGGLAVGFRGETRFTKDIDLAVAVNDDQAAEALVFALRGRGYETLAVLEHRETGGLATIRCRPPRDVPGRVVDLVVRSCGIEREIVEAARTESFLGREVSVVCTEHLLVMKLISQDVDIRATDRADILTLIDHADESQLDAARRLARLVVDRGFHRDRDLPGDLEHFIRVARQRRESGESF